MKHSQSLRPEQAERSESDRSTNASEEQPSCERDGCAPVERRAESSGLCMTCVHVGTCTFLRRDTPPVLFCEEFDGQQEHRSGASAEVMAQSVTVHTQATYMPERSSKFNGLCATCEKRELCTFPKAEGGVWHCEEFE